VDYGGRVGAFDRLTYYSAKFVAQAAQNLLLAALFITAGTTTEAAIDLSSLFVASLAPAVLFGLVGGAVVDRIGPARGLALGALLRLVPVIAAAGFMRSPSEAWLVAFAYATGSQVFSPSEMAMVRCIQRDSPGKAHSLLVTLQYGGQALGMLLLAPSLYYLGGPRTMLVGAALGLVLLNAITLLLAVRLRATDAGRMQTSREAFTFRQTCRFFAGEARARYALVVIAFKVIVSRGIVVALPFYLRHDLGLGKEAIVYLFVPGAVGMLAGLLWASRAGTVDRAQSIMRLSLAGMILSVMALAALDYGVTAAAQYSQLPPIARLEASLNTTFAVAIPAAFLLGLSVSGALVSARVAITETAPAGQQARVWAVQMSLTETLIALPLVLTGVGTQWAGARVALAGIGVMALVALAVIERPARRATAPAPTGVTSAQVHQPSL
jgi:MFS family permease